MSHYLEASFPNYRTDGSRYRRGAQPGAGIHSGAVTTAVGVVAAPVISGFGLWTF